MLIILRFDYSIGADLISSDWVMQCERRTLNDIRALGGNDSADEWRFATAARVSEINLALYRTFAAPLVRAMMSAPVAEWMRRIHPLWLQYKIFSDANPFMAIVKNVADHVRKARKPVANDNPYLALQGILSEQIIAGLNTWQHMAETLAPLTTHTCQAVQRSATRAHVPDLLRITAAAGGGRDRSGG